MDPKAAANALQAMSPARLKKLLNRAGPEVVAPIIDKVFPTEQAALVSEMDPELAANVLPRLRWVTDVFGDLEPQYATIILSLLSSADVGRVLALSPRWSGSPDPLDGVFDYLQPDQVEDYLSRISPVRALKLLTARGQDRADRFFDQLEPETAASVFNEMEGEPAAAWLVRADPDRVALVLEKASPKSATRALNLLDQQQMELLLARMRPVQAKLLRIAMPRLSD